MHYLPQYFATETDSDRVEIEYIIECAQLILIILEVACISL